ncbi:hypothetical protein LRP30_06445 [Bradyrhizobium sp. C-145]|uniref:hypothetical protein n=1 Tax=Bradyrhizobium sp. C-145 TaxID=574727 RepID=UPI00201B5897|nr:hypothetical protein [Bradyrhizobium sp. C-145]UQR64922.1 hypothetical protein LRP30_06445 [Bradyrhizobium sp. C-145]
MTSLKDYRVAFRSLTENLHTATPSGGPVPGAARSRSMSALYLGACGVDLAKIRD